MEDKNEENLKKQLSKAKILIKMQNKMLKNFVLHDDAGTAYVYLGPHPEDVKNLTESKGDLDNVSGIQKYEYILESLYEIQSLLERQDVSEESLSAIELLQDTYLEYYMEQREKRQEDQ